MENIDLNNLEVRLALIASINSKGNKERKEESLKRFEIFNDRQGQYIQDALVEEFDVETVKGMRVVKSVNISKRIIQEQASIYNDEPERNYSNASEKEDEQLENLNRFSLLDQKLKMANRYFKLYNDQIILKVLPKNGVLNVDVLYPHNFDAVPDANDPNQAYAYILSVHDKFDSLNQLSQDTTNTDKLRSSSVNIEPDGVNQVIADPEDYKALEDRYVVWTADLNFTMNGKGMIIAEDVSQTVNEIGVLPFVDISAVKDNEFFRRYGSNVTDFTIEFGVGLSDLSNVARLQSYAQAVMTSVKKPAAIRVGPMQAMWLQQSEDRDAPEPKFEFVTPSPDLSGAAMILENSLRIFLSAEGADTTSISSSAGANSPTSGIERLLRLIERFEASKEDISFFRFAEHQIFNLFRLWSNKFQGIPLELGGLIADLNIAQLSEQIELEIAYAEPKLFQTKADVEDSEIKKLDKGLTTKKRAIMRIEGVNEDMALEILEEVDSEREASLKSFNLGGVDVSADIQENESPAEDKP